MNALVMLADIWRPNLQDQRRGSQNPLWCVWIRGVSCWSGRGGEGGHRRPRHGRLLGHGDRQVPGLPASGFPPKENSPCHIAPHLPDAGSSDQAQRYPWRGEEGSSDLSGRRPSRYGFSVQDKLALIFFFSQNNWSIQNLKEKLVTIFLPCRHKCWVQGRPWGLPFGVRDSGKASDFRL